MERKGVPDQAVFQHVGPPPTGYTSAQKLAKTSDHPVRGVVHQSRVMECHDRGSRHCLQLVGDARFYVRGVGLSRTVVREGWLQVCHSTGAAPWG